MEDTFTLPLSEHFTVNLKAGTALSKTPGIMKDSDWLRSNYSQPDIYSESNTRLYSALCDIHLGYTLANTHFSTHHSQKIIYGLGYAYNTTHWTCSDTEQWYPLDPSMSTKMVRGPVLTYQLNQNRPYLDFSILHTFESSSFKITLGLAPYLTLSDNDNHMLRSKLATSSDKGGYGHWITAEFNKPITPHWTAGATLTYKTLAAWGKQKQSRYAATTEGPAEFISEIDHQIKMNTTALGLNMTYHWQDLDEKPNKNFEQKTQLKNTFVKPSFGITYYAPFHEHQPCFGPVADVSFSKFIVDIRYLKELNTIETMSLGTYSRFPIYYYDTTTAVASDQTRSKSVAIPLNAMWVSVTVQL